MKRPKSSLIAAVFAACFLSLPLAAKEPYADLYQSIGDAEEIVIGRISETRDDGAVLLQIDTWIKGETKGDKAVLLSGSTGFCCMGGPISQFVSKGQRYLVFLFPDGRIGRLGHYQEIDSDGNLPDGSPRYMYVGDNPPRNETEFVALIRYVLSADFVSDQLDLLKQPDIATRRQAVVRIGQARAQAAFTDLLTLVEDQTTDRRLRNQAIVAMGRLKNPAAIEPLTKILSQEACSWAAAALGELRDKRAVLPLLSAFWAAMTKEQYDPVSSECIASLGRIGVYSDDVRAAFKKAVTTRGEYPATTAINLAVEQRLAWLVPSLEKAAQSDTPSVAANAKRALELLRQPIIDDSVFPYLAVILPVLILLLVLCGLLALRKRARNKPFESDIQ